MSSWFTFVIGDTLLDDFLWDKHVVFQISFFALHFKVVPAAMKSFFYTCHPMKRVSELVFLCCALSGLRIFHV